MDGQREADMAEVAMTLVERGTTRVVAMAGPVAVKFARGEADRRCNLYEAKVWELNKHDPVSSPHLCPVLWCSADAWVLAMQAAELLPPDALHPYDTLDEWWSYDPAKGPHDVFPGEPKASDWGVLDGRVVLLDYSNPALPEPPEIPPDEPADETAPGVGSEGLFFAVIAVPRRPAAVA
jgi:hypothetical protein